jgi:phage terminase Nu1 subunit (DNA packaging protein)
LFQVSIGLAQQIPERRKANKAEVAEWFGMSVATVDAWIRRGCPAVQRGARGVPWVFDLLQVAQWRFAAPAAPGGDGSDETDPDSLTPKERLDWYKGEAEKRKLQVADGQLLPAVDHERQMAELLKLSVNWAETFPDVMERDAGLSPEQVERVQAAVDRQRERLHQTWVGDADV